MSYIRRNLVSILLFILWVGMAASVTTAHADVQGGGAAQKDHSIVLVFTTHLEADLPAMDVFIERERGTGFVYRPTTRDSLDAMLYRTAAPVARGSFELQRIGPHPKGDAFNMTLGEWAGHSGSGTYRCQDGEGTVSAEFSGLVPNGVYTMWHTFTAALATRPFSGYLDLPLGARDGSTSVFVADMRGEASFERTFAPCLQMSDGWLTAMLAVNFHSDNRTHGGLPGDFGQNVHTPLFLVLPQRTSLPASD
jgi:hypothetical protein